MSINRSNFTKFIQAGFWGEVRGGAHLPWYDFAPPQIFSTSPKNFRISPNNINEINFKKKLYKLDKKV